MLGIDFRCLELTRLEAEIFREKQVFSIDNHARSEWPQSVILTHCGLVTPYGDRDLGQYWLR